MASLGASACALCAAGTYSSRVGLEEACDGCARGFFSTSPGMTHAGGCERCATGSTTSQAGGTACNACGPGEFPNELFGACAACPANSEAGLNASEPDACRCSAGYRLGYNTRAQGGEESYRIMDGGRVRRVHRLMRDEDVFRLLLPTVIEATCDGSPFAPPSALAAGEYPNMKGGCATGMEIQYDVDVVANQTITETYVQCVPCSEGTFSAGMTARQCQPCPNQTFQDQTGATSCKPCPTGRATSEGMPTCEPCPGRTVLQDGECKPCPEGTFNPTFIQQPACLLCPINMWSVQGADDCRLCPQNSVSPGGTGFSGCRCIGGLEMRGDVCAACGVGKYSPPGGNACVLCGNGTYSRVTGASACLSCGTRGVSGPGATACRDCALGTIPSRDGGTCVPCPAGYYCGLGVVFACPLGTYTLRTGLTSRSQCPPCPRDHFCRSPTTIQQCPANTWSPLGSITRHYCRCNTGYKCTYYFTASGIAVVTLTPDQLQEQALVEAVAQAAGVHPSKVQIVSVTNNP